jgi:hypothetical protein
MSTGIITPNLQTYLNLIPSPNNLAQNFMDWVQAIGQLYIDQQTCIAALIQAFNIDTAVGVQLDIIGQLVGVSRILNFTPSNGVSPTLIDAEYQTILYAQILKNFWNGTTGQVYSFWQQYLPQFPITIIDNQDMTMTVWIAGMSGLQQELTANGYYVPKPAGVLVNYIFGNGPYFAFDISNQYFAGFDLGAFVTVPV